MGVLTYFNKFIENNDFDVWNRNRITPSYELDKCLLFENKIYGRNKIFQIAVPNVMKTEFGRAFIFYILTKKYRVPAELVINILNLTYDHPAQAHVDIGVYFTYQEVLNKRALMLNSKIIYCKFYEQYFWLTYHPFFEDKNYLTNLIKHNCISGNAINFNKSTTLKSGDQVYTVVTLNQKYINHFNYLYLMQIRIRELEHLKSCSICSGGSYCFNYQHYHFNKKKIVDEINMVKISRKNMRRYQKKQYRKQNHSKH